MHVFMARNDMEMILNGITKKGEKQFKEFNGHFNTRQQIWMKGGCEHAESTS